MRIRESFFLACAIIFLSLSCMAQTPPASSPLGSYQQDLQRKADSSTGAWTTEQIANMGRLRDAALQDSFALDELRRLTDNIGPRISGSRQAEHAVDYVAAEMRALGTDVDPLNKKGVPGFCPNQDSPFYFNYHHTAADTFDKVDTRELNENAAVMTVLAYALADSAVPAPR